MSVLVLGGTGFIGGPVVARLLADGVETAVAHHGARAVPAGAASVVLNRRDPAAVLAAVRDLGVDTVIDLIAYTRADTLPLLDALAGRVARYVLVSSVDVYRNYEGLHRKGRPPIWDRLTEDAPLRASRFPYRLAKPRPAGDPQAWMDGYDKITPGRGRPGEGRAGDHHPAPADGVRAGRPAAAVLVGDPAHGPGPAAPGDPPPVGQLAGDLRLCRRRGGGRALAALSPRAGGETYNLGRANTPTNIAWAAGFAEHLNWPGDVQLAHPDVARGALAKAVSGLDLSYPLFVDNAKIRRRLGYTEVTDLDEALARTVADEMAR